MAGTNAHAVKKALVDQLAALPALAAVQVAYCFPGRTLQRECIYAGRVESAVQLAAMAPAAGRLRREEDAVLHLHIVVDAAGEDTTETAEARAAELGAVVENHLAGNPKLDDVPGLLVARVVGHDLDSGVDDESAEAVLTYQIALKSYLT